MFIGALEAGGTKMVCAVFDLDGMLVKKIRIPTTTPEETMPKMFEFFHQYPIQALGIASFGPITLHKESEHYGEITTTPKVSWRNFNIYQAFMKEFSIPIALDTDVNVACLGEMKFGAALGCKSVVYITVGTGVGVGICVDGHILHGMMHPEAGHMLVKRHREDDFEGICGFHKDCIEGLCSGPAILARKNKPAELLEEDDCAWKFTAYYLAQMVVNLILTVSPEKVILGGGVLKREFLIARVREQTTAFLAGYVATEQLMHMDEYLVLPEGKELQGVRGAYLLAKDEIC